MSAAVADLKKPWLKAIRLATVNVTWDKKEVGRLPCLILHVPSPRFWDKVKKPKATIAILGPECEKKDPFKSSVLEVEFDYLEPLMSADVYQARSSFSKKLLDCWGPLRDALNEIVHLETSVPKLTQSHDFYYKQCITLTTDVSRLTTEKADLTNQNQTLNEEKSRLNTQVMKLESDIYGLNNTIKQFGDLHTTETNVALAEARLKQNTEDHNRTPYKVLWEQQMEIASKYTDRNLGLIVPEFTQRQNYTKFICDDLLNSSILCGVVYDVYHFVNDALTCLLESSENAIDERCALMKGGKVKTDELKNSGFLDVKKCGEFVLKRCQIPLDEEQRDKIQDMCASLIYVCFQIALRAPSVRLEPRISPDQRVRFNPDAHVCNPNTAHPAVITAQIWPALWHGRKLISKGVVEVQPIGSDFKSDAKSGAGLVTAVNTSAQSMQPNPIVSHSGNFGGSTNAGAGSAIPVSLAKPVQPSVESRNLATNPGPNGGAPNPGAPTAEYY